MILDEIMAHKRRELRLRRKAVPLSHLQSLISDRPAPLDFSAALARPGVSLIAEVKRASPSKGVLRPDLDPVRLATAYAANGAAALSVLTDARFFQGSLIYLGEIKQTFGERWEAGEQPSASHLAIPILRKDFIFDPYQVYETRAHGADAVLLIAAVLPGGLLGELLALARDLGLTALVEVHDEAEIERVLPFAPRVVGINNRDLRDFSVDLATFGRLRPLLPGDVVAVAESGVHTAADVRRLAGMGADAVLVGEALVTASDVAAKVRELAGAGRMETVAR